MDEGVGRSGSGSVRMGVGRERDVWIGASLRGGRRTLLRPAGRRGSMGIEQGSRRVGRALTTSSSTRGFDSTTPQEGRIDDLEPLAILRHSRQVDTRTAFDSALERCTLREQDSIYTISGTDPHLPSHSHSLTLSPSLSLGSRTSKYPYHVSLPSHPLLPPSPPTLPIS